MKYFLHDCNALQDEKITELFLKYGYEGIGLFYVTLEKIAAQEKPIKTEVLKAQLKIGKRLEKCWSFMESLGILSSSNGETFNERILSYSEKYKIKKEKNRERIAQFRENHSEEKNVTHYTDVTKRDSNAPKVKESKVNRINIPFGDFWSLYDKKIGRKDKLEKKWQNLTDEERIKALNFIPFYVKETPDKKYRKNPETFLNNKSWNDELSEKVIPMGGELKKMIM